MDSLGEVGKKMRSAIKAKLLELGTGTQTGYIDDELPDYVMIMVANKRSKPQMTNDLNLFLGSNTETFVNWLHQVLQKLQEVTLPNNLASKSKKKTAEATNKKEKKKDKRKGKEPSITDVIAVELMEKEKAKRNLESVPGVKKEDTMTPSPPPAPLIAAKEADPPTVPRIDSSRKSDSENGDDEFNIPTISEIKTTAVTGNLHMRELSQLQELQNRIYETKQKLKDLNSNSEDDEVPEAKSSILSRLGVKPTENSKPSNIISLSAIRRTEKEIYVAPTFRKLIERQKQENERRTDESTRRQSRVAPRRERRSRSRSRSRSRERHRARRERSRSPIRRSRSPRTTRPSIHQRIGSRVVVVSPDKDVPIKVKSRPVISSAIGAQAGKNLLLRAVAEAQRSTAFPAIESRNKTTPRDNIVVHVPLCKDKRNIRIDEEYVPESISTQSESEAEYHPSYNKSSTAEDGDDGDVIYLNNNEDADLEDLDNDEQRKSPQFVVTLEGITQFDRRSKSSHSPTPPPVIKRKSIKDRIGSRPIDTFEERQPPVKRKVEEESESQRAYNRAKRARLSPIKFDLTDEEEEEDEKCSRNSSNRRSETPEKKDQDQKSDELNGDENAKRIKLEPSRSFDHVPAFLSSVAVPVSDSSKPLKSKERCKFYPSCSNNSCPFFHPTLPCKLFPTCKFGDSCAYVHPRCMFDLSCAKVECNFSHSQAASVGQIMPPIASSVVPVQNYKSISITPNTTICKFFPVCTNTNCIFLHPKVCRFGKACMKKFDCNFYHFETSSKFKWVNALS